MAQKSACLNLSPPPRVLTIAGSDSSGGAGIEADLKVIAAHGCYGMTSITALTAQNTQGVSDIHVVPAGFLKREIEAVMDDVGVDVVKTGMLACQESIIVVADALKKYKINKTVVDPVFASTSGHLLLLGSAISSMIDHLLPLTYILTPNILEAKAMLMAICKVQPSESGEYDNFQGYGPEAIESLDHAVNLAKTLYSSLRPRYILLKGGHLPYVKGENNKFVVAKSEQQKQFVVDILWDGKEISLFESPYINSQNTHGTGCSLSSAIACNLARGLEIRDAVGQAIKYVAGAITSSALTTAFIGKGNNKPINHLHDTKALPFPPGHFVEYVINHPKVKGVWKEYTEHEFVKKIADGTLEPEKFQWYLIQDYLFLIQFSRANALAAYKSKNIDDIAKAASIVLHIQRELSLHIEYCKNFGITKEEIEKSHESQACTAYTRFVLDIGQSQDFFALQVAMAPCLIGYGQIGQALYRDQKTRRREDGNAYWSWIENYGGSGDYLEAVRAGRELLEKYAIRQSRERIEELVDIWGHATRMERGFWSMGLTPEDM